MYLHDSLGVPEDGVGVEVSRWVKPQAKLLLPAAFSLTEDIGVKSVWLTRDIAQELKIYLIMGCPL